MSARKGWRQWINDQTKCCQGWWNYNAARSTHAHSEASYDAGFCVMSHIMSFCTYSVAFNTSTKSQTHIAEREMKRDCRNFFGRLFRYITEVLCSAYSWMSSEPFVCVVCNVHSGLRTKSLNQYSGWGVNERCRINRIIVLKCKWQTESVPLFAVWRLKISGSRLNSSSLEALLQRTASVGEGLTLTWTVTSVEHGRTPPS